MKLSKVTINQLECGQLLRTGHCCAPYTRVSLNNEIESGTWERRGEERRRASRCHFLFLRCASWVLRRHKCPSEDGRAIAQNVSLSEWAAPKLHSEYPVDRINAVEKLREKDAFRSTPPGPAEK